MARMSNAWYVAQAVARYDGKKGTEVSKTEITDEPPQYDPPQYDTNGPEKAGVYLDGTPTVAKSTKGAWVMLWAWVPDPNQEDEKDATKTEDAGRPEPAQTG